jgi:hypothetical protein
MDFKINHPSVSSPVGSSPTGIVIALMTVARVCIFESWGASNSILNYVEAHDQVGARHSCGLGLLGWEQGAYHVRSNMTVRAHDPPR